MKKCVTDEVTVVVTDNKRYSVILSYDIESEDSAPKAVAKGEYDLADFINQNAKTKGVDCFESPFLACMLFHMTETGEEVSQEHYYPVAQIFAFVINTRVVRDYHLKRPKPDNYLLRNMGLNIKTMTQN